MTKAFRTAGNNSTNKQEKPSFCYFKNTFLDFQINIGLSSALVRKGGINANKLELPDLFYTYYKLLELGVYLG